MAQGQLDYRATATAPVHLMRNSQGATFTAVIEKQPGTGELRLKKRPVTPDEIARLGANGIKLVFLPDPDESISSGSEDSPAGTKQGYPSSYVPASFTIMRLYGYTYGGFWTTATRPNGASTQWSNFYLLSNGFSATTEHVAHALFVDGAALSGSPPAIIGNGMLIGKSEGYPGPWHVGCGPTNNLGYYAEVESFWRNGNALYPATCAPSGLLNDGRLTRITLHANTTEWVTYWVFQNNSSDPAYTSPPVQTTQRPDFDLAQGGVLFTVTGGDGQIASPDYMLSFTNVATGWF